MNNMLKVAPAIVLTALSSCGTDYRPPDAMVLIDNERAFAAAVAEKGMRDGFLQCLADDAVLFAPEAVNGKEYYGAGPQRPGLLTWTPIYAEIASSGDMGYTTGPWEFREESMADTPAVSGHYNTIWKLQPDSSWRFVIDIGVAHPPHRSAPAPPALRVLDRPDQAGTVNLNQARSELIQLEYTFSTASVSEGLVAAYVSRVANDVRYYRQGEIPRQGVAAITTALSTVEGTWTWEPTAADVSADGDLGYAYGVSHLVSGRTVRSFSYAHIWRKAGGGRWQLALDIHIPLATAQTEETG